jgi:hypothetical protein
LPYAIQQTASGGETFFCAETEEKKSDDAAKANRGTERLLLALSEGEE